MGDRPPAPTPSPTGPSPDPGSPGPEPPPTLARARRGLAVLAAALPLALASGLGAPAAASAQDLPDGVTRETVERGREIYGEQGFCYTCHGRQGGGIAELGSNLADDAWVHVDGSLEELVSVIREGVPAEASSTGVPMPPRGGARLTAEQVRAVAAYVWVLSRRP